MGVVWTNLELVDEHCNGIQLIILALRIHLYIICVGQGREWL